jgi:hypothetical protein
MDSCFGSVLLRPLKNGSALGRRVRSNHPKQDLNFDVIDQVSPFVTDSVWIGKMNQLPSRLSLNEEKDPATIQKATQLEQWQSDGNIKHLYSQFKDNPLIKWKESIKTVLGLKVSIVAGLDV